MNNKHSYKEQIEAIRKLDKKTVQKAFEKACKMSGLNIDETNMKTKQKYPTHLTITKNYGPEVSSIKLSHYTKFKEHPEDRIFKDREYIQRLQEHIDYVFEHLDHDLRLNEKGRDWLFDYIFNEDSKDIEFEEYLEKYNVKYKDCVTSNKWYHKE
jgi:hypothetical protein